MTTLRKAFDVASASVVGAIHRKRGCGGQDGLSVLHTGRALIAVVTDGCGGAPRSEVGARVGARLWARALAAVSADGDALSTIDIGRAKADVVASLGALADAMTAPNEDRDQVVAEHMLFTTIAAVVTERWTTVFAIGDGIVGLDDAWLALEPATGNRPAYVGYELIDGLEPLSALTLFTSLPTSMITSLVLATDGASPLLAEGELAALCADEAVRSNRDALRRALESEATTDLDIDWERERVVRRRPRLTDDTTIISITRALSVADRSVA